MMYLIQLYIYMIVHLGGPPLVKAATGEIVSAEDLGGADVHCKVSGVTDHYAMNDEHALNIARSIVANLNWTENTSVNFHNNSSISSNDHQVIEDPLFSSDEMANIIPADNKKPFDIRKVIARIGKYILYITHI